MTRQLHAAVPTSETPGSRLQKAEHSNEGSMSSIEFLRSTIGILADRRLAAHNPLCRIDKSFTDLAFRRAATSRTSPRVLVRGFAFLATVKILPAGTTTSVAPFVEAHPEGT